MATAFGRHAYTALRPTSTHGQDTTVSGVTSISVPESATLVLIQAIAKNVRVTIDNGSTDPTASKGFQVAAGTAQYFPCGGMTTIKVIEESASATIEYQFFF